MDRDFMADIGIVATILSMFFSCYYFLLLGGENEV